MEYIFDAFGGLQKAIILFIRYISEIPFVIEWRPTKSLKYEILDLASTFREKLTFVVSVIFTFYLTSLIEMKMSHTIMISVLRVKYNSLCMIKLITL